MNWFRENRWLGTFLIVFGFALLGALFFLFSAKSGFEAAVSQFNEAAAERTRLEHLNPFPNESNFKKMKQDIANYGASLTKLKDDLKSQVLPMPALAPNEFQSRLRQASVEVAEKMRTSKVKLPDNFHLGFDEYTSALPNTAAAPVLGQELAQIELLMNLLADAHIDAVTALKRTPLAEERSATTAPSPSAVGARKPPGQAASGPKMVERAVVDIGFTASPSAGRRVLNQIASSSQQFFIVRTLHVRNEQDKGPPREGAASVSTPAGVPGTAATTTAPTPSGALRFIVGNEHIEVAAQIELVRFIF